MTVNNSPDGLGADKAMSEDDLCEWKGLILPLDTESIDGPIMRRTDLKAPIHLPIPLLQLGSNSNRLAGFVTRVEETPEGIYGLGVTADKDLVERLRNGDRVPVGADADGHLLAEWAISSLESYHNVAKGMQEYRGPAMHKPGYTGGKPASEVGAPMSVPSASLSGPLCGCPGGSTGDAWRAGFEAGQEYEQSMTESNSPVESVLAYVKHLEAAGLSGVGLDRLVVKYPDPGEGMREEKQVKINRSEVERLVVAGIGYGAFTVVVKAHDDEYAVGDVEMKCIANADGSVDIIILMTEFFQALANEVWDLSGRQDPIVINGDD